MDIYTIYKIKNNINQKIYIGFTSDSNTRWNKHIKNSKSNNGYAIHKAIRKYDKNNFTFEEIYQSKDKDHTLNDMEPYFIKLYNTYNYGYNCTIGGQGGNLGKTLTEETKQKIRTSRLGKKHTKESIQKMSKAKKGKTFSKEHKKNLGKGHEKTYEITFKNNSTIIISNITRWSKENNYTVGSLMLLKNNKRTKHKDIIKVKIL